MTALFSFDDAEFARNLAKQKEREEKKNQPKTKPTYVGRKIKQKEFRKIRKEFNRPSKPHFVLPNGQICTEIYFSDGIKGIKKITAEVFGLRLELHRMKRDKINSDIRKRKEITNNTDSLLEKL